MYYLCLISKIAEVIYENFQSRGLKIHVFVGLKYNKEILEICISRAEGQMCLNDY